MTTTDPFTQLREAVEEELYPYGQYLAMRGAREGEQRFGVPELALATLTVVVWAAQQFLQAYFQERGKQLAQPNTETEVDLKKLHAEIMTLREELKGAQQWKEEMETRWATLARQLPANLPMQIPSKQIDDGELLEILLSSGLSERIAHKVSTGIKRQVETSSTIGNEESR